ncbi:MAG: PrsW family intramembrane metalloprotease, partial [Woeseiaceae bacterium]|nr:PrsW family intramembrane metalloprotease [Woeseiaceae bacterium]
MSTFSMLMPVLLPALFWAGYHYHKDRHLPEPAGHLLLCFVLGGVAAVLAKGMYVSLGYFGLRFDAFELAATNLPGLFAYAMLAIGPIEELAKLLPFLLLVLRFSEFDEPIDGIIYASFIGLGFAAAENLYYLQFLTPIEAIARGFASPVVHIVFASIWGYRIGAARISGRTGVGVILTSFAIAALLHGLYDYIVLQQPFFALPVAAGIIVAIWIWRLKIMQKLHADATQS